jgi:hypothetical protein
MQNHNARLVTVIAGAVALLAVFVSWRARTFHYCVGNGERAQNSRLTDGNEPCAPNEQPMDWQDQWRERGLRSKLRMLGSTTVEAFDGK